MKEKMMTPDRKIMKTRQEAAVALQRLVFRANQQKGFVKVEDCMEVTDLITVSVIESFAQYLPLMENENAAS
jgi:hypothetical protein